MLKAAKKRMGRPPGRKLPYPLQITVSDDHLKIIDEFRRTQPDLPARTEAVRRMIESFSKPSKGRQK